MFALPPLKILYEDTDLFVVNKPAGVVTHPAGCHYRDSLANQVSWYFRSKKENMVIRPVGRLDRETSGIVIFAKNQAAARLQAQCRHNQLKKQYLAVVSGYLPVDSCPEKIPPSSFSDPFSQEHTISFPIGPNPEDSRKMTVLLPDITPVSFPGILKRALHSNIPNHLRMEILRLQSPIIRYFTVPLTGLLLRSVWIPDGPTRFVYT